MLNKVSRIITNNGQNGAAIAMLLASGVDDFNKPIIGVGTMWFEGNPCNNHLNKISDNISKNLNLQGVKSLQFNTIGVSDGISMGTSGMKYSLPSREIIADSIEIMANAHHYDGLVLVPGCDKNVPGSIMGLLRVNRPSYIICGGSIKPGIYKDKKVDIVAAFRSYGQEMRGEMTKDERKELLSCACNGSGGCAGMYTYNTMTMITEVMGLTLPNSSSNLAESDEKVEETKQKVIINLLEKNIKPKDIITRESLLNATKLLMVIGGSTNAVLHLLAIAKTAGVDYNLEDIIKIREKTPLLCNFQPFGEYLMSDLYEAGGTSKLIKYLIKYGILNGDLLTITGKTLKENLEPISYFYDKTNCCEYHFPIVDTYNTQYHKIVKHIDNPIKTSGHIHIMKGNLAPEGSVAKITGKEGDFFRGPAIVFNSEEDMINNVNNIKEGDVIVIRFVGPKGGPGMPEMLKPTSLINGLGLDGKVAIITDGRFSGGSSGFIIGHITPEAYDGGPISKLKNGDIITIDSNNNTINVKDNVLTRVPKLVYNNVDSQCLYKYQRLVSNASLGCTL